MIHLALTGREREVLGELIGGHYRKLDVGSTAAATAMALRHQLV